MTNQKKDSAEKLAEMHVSMVRRMPWIKLAAASAVGIIILDAWYSGLGAVGDALGLDRGLAAIVLGTAVIAGGFAVLTYLRKRKG